MRKFRYAMVRCVNTKWPDDARRDRLVKQWHLYQRKGGHRTSTDDLIVAWLCCHRAIQAKRCTDQYLDLGCGIGSVLLMTAHRLRPQCSVGIEAQATSVKMARRSIKELPEEAPHIEIDRADFREVAFEHRAFDIITGSPPYFPMGTGVLPSDSQRRACRFEVRGGIEDYCQSARRALSDDGRFYVVSPSQSHARTQQAARMANLQLSYQVDFRMRSDRDQPFLSVYEFRIHRDAVAKPTAVLAAESICVRNQNGEVTDEYQRLRDELGLNQ